MSCVDYHADRMAYRYVTYDALDERSYVAMVLRDLHRRWKFVKIERNWIGKRVTFKAHYDCLSTHFATHATAYDCGYAGRAA